MMIQVGQVITAWDIETARRAYANAVLANLDEDTIARARGWLEWLVEMARRQR